MGKGKKKKGTMHANVLPKRLMPKFFPLRSSTFVREEALSVTMAQHSGDSMYVATI
jgi:hypothetical protein